jgi:peptidyl-prolyl cis-trans isomerase B (cyclophilin B)
VLRATASTSLAALAALAAVACGGGDDGSTTAGLPSGCEPVEAPAPKPGGLEPPHTKLSRGEDVSAVVDTSCGVFTIALDTANFPKTASSFVNLADEGFYDGTSFSYVDGSVVQGGDPTGDRTGGPGYSVDESVPFDTEYTRGTVAMAKTEVEPTGRSGSQFFVVYAADAGLQPQFAVLGRVTEGMDVIDRISQLYEPGSDSGAPSAPVVIDSVTLDHG